MYSTAVPFSRTMRSLNVERSTGFILGIALAALILSGWVIWLIGARVSVYAASEASRLEAFAASLPVQSVYAGRISATNLVLGRKVKRGEVLVELDSSVQRLQMLEEESQGNSLHAELEAVRRQVVAEQRMAVEAERAAQIGIAEARAKLQEGEAAAAYAGQEADRQILLEREGLTPKREFGSAMAEVRKQKAAVESLRLAIGRQERELASQKSERISRIEALKREADRLAGEETKLGATVKRLNSEVTLRQIVAPTDGVIGEVANFRVGSVISAGEKLGAIIPAGRLKVVAAFDPGKALGRVHPGQKARLRLAGFPWTQYGTLPATVTGVANEVRDGYVRVELSPSPDSRIPLQHGLPAITEIEVERVSPARLLLRLAGQSLTGRSQQPTANDSQSAAPGRQQ